MLPCKNKVTMELTLTPVIRNQRNRYTGRFAAGMTPWNKGISYPQPCNKGRFKKGSLPHNTRKDGDISIRIDSRSGLPYKYIRLAKSKWVLLHRHAWQKHHGPIPHGYVVRFKDGNTLNCDLTNLEVLSQAENMERNRNYSKSSNTMKELWKSEKLRHKLGLNPLSGFGKRMNNNNGGACSTANK